MSNCTFERFTKDVAAHVLTVQRDDGVFRHLTMKSPTTSEMYYQIITWPGYLCYCGDMGSFLFQRADDMFKFFRNGNGGINPTYWAEKVESADRDGVKAFNRDEFERAVNEVLSNWLEFAKENHYDDEFIADEKSKVDDLIAESHQNMHHAIAALNNFDTETNGVSFDDFWENSCETFTHRYIWCCYAIVHAIAQYDAAKAKEVAA